VIRAKRPNVGFTTKTPWTPRSKKKSREFATKRHRRGTKRTEKGEEERRRRGER
jgi:hypothetical protein